MLQDWPLCPIPSVLVHSIPPPSCLLVHFFFYRLQAPQGQGACFIFHYALSTVPDTARPSISCSMLKAQPHLFDLLQSLTSTESLNAPGGILGATTLQIHSGYVSAMNSHILTVQHVLLMRRILSSEDSCSEKRL